MRSRFWLWLGLLGAAALAVVSPLAASQQLRSRLAVSLGSEYDSNARRVVEGPSVVQDGVLRSALAADLAYQLGPHQLEASTNLGVKIFWQERDENTAAAMLDARYRAALPHALWIGASLHARGRRLLDAERDYESASLDATLVYAGLHPLVLEGRLGPRVFVYEPAPNFSNAGLGAGLWARLAVLGREQIAVGYDLDTRYFPDALALSGIRPDGTLEHGSEQRADLRHAVAVRVVSSRRLYLNAGYTFVVGQSNSLGERFSRHQLQLIVATQLPLDLFASVTAGLQIASYPGGLALSQRLLLEDSDESQNKLVLTLRRPLWRSLAVEGRAALFSNELSDSGLAFARSTTYLGVVYTH